MFHAFRVTMRNDILGHCYHPLNLHFRSNGLWDSNFIAFMQAVISCLNTKCPIGTLLFIKLLKKLSPYTRRHILQDGAINLRFPESHLSDYTGFLLKQTRTRCFLSQSVFIRSTQLLCPVRSGFIISSICVSEW